MRTILLPDILQRRSTICRRSAIALASVLAALLVYGRVLTTYFLSDDFDLIGQVATRGFFVGWAGFVRPLVVLSYLVDFWIWGLNPTGFHVTNVVLHALNALLVGVLTLTLGRATSGETNPALAIAAGAIFLTLSCHTESVSWIAGRTDVIASAFMLSSLVAHLKFLETRRSWAAVASLTAFGLALLSKESAIAFPAVVAVLTFVLTRRVRATVRFVAPFAAVLAGYALLSYVVADAGSAAYIREHHVAFDASRSAFGRTAFNLFSSSVRVVLPPLPQSVADLIVTNWHENLYMSPRRWLVVALGAAVLTAVFAHVVRRRSTWKPGWLLIPALAGCFVMTQPLLGYTSVSLADTRDERFLYFSSVFVAIGVVFLASRIGFSRRTLAAALGIWLAATSWALWHVNGTWATAGALARTVAKEVTALASADTVIVTNLPERYRGAWIFRNGFREAVTIFEHLPDSVHRLEILSLHPIRSIGDTVLLKRAGDIWSIDLPPYAEPLTFEIPGAPILSRSAHGFTIKLMSPDSELLYYSAGRAFKADNNPGDRRE
jgi:hypothetical protein